MKFQKILTPGSKFIFIPVLVIFLFFSYSGCLSFHTHPAGIEPEVYTIREKEYEIVEHSSGQSSSFRLFWFLPVTDEADFKRAVDYCIHEKGGDNLINVRIWHEKQYWILGTINIIFVEGDVIRYK